MTPEVEGLRVLKPLGAGRSGTTYLAVDCKDGHEVAAKCILRGDRVDEHVLREVLIQRALRSRRCVRLRDVRLTSTHLVLVLDVCKGGDLFSLLKTAAPNPHVVRALPELLAWLILHELIRAVQYIHRRGIAHRDIKPENVLLVRKIDIESTSAPAVKLCDFGFSVLYAGRTCDGNRVAHSRANVSGVDSCTSLPAVGTTAYVAPEVLDDDIPEYDPFAADVWSIGVVFYTMLVPRLPFQDPLDVGKSYKGMVERIKQGRYKRVQRGVISTEAEDLLERVFVVDAAHRIRLDEMLDMVKTQIQKLRAAAERSVGEDAHTSTQNGSDLQHAGKLYEAVREDEVRRLSLHLQVAAHVAAASQVASVASPVHVATRVRPYAGERSPTVLSVQRLPSVDASEKSSRAGSRSNAAGKSASEPGEYGLGEHDNDSGASTSSSDVDEHECAKSCEELSAMVAEARTRVVRKRAPPAGSYGLSASVAAAPSGASPPKELGPVSPAPGTVNQNAMMASLMAGMFSPGRPTAPR
mmetsp:Transcript_12212/g.32893  ORF Transcript_12212/g.32893 Transcript_12212/m.32893 type:complete len:524 (+) Transcript_12212:22-1593(+)